MRTENEAMELESSDDSDFSSDESIDFDSPEKPTIISRFLCKGQRINQVKTLDSPHKFCIILFYILIPAYYVEFQGSRRLSVRIEGESQTKPSFRVSINPWKLIKLTREKALLAAEKARERLVKEKPSGEHIPLKPLPLETKCGPLMSPDKNMGNTGSSFTPFTSKGRQPGSPGRFSSPRRRLSGSPTLFANILASPQHKYRSSFDLKLTGVSRELETHISRQVLCSVISKDESEPSPS